LIIDSLKQTKEKEKEKEKKKKKKKQKKMSSPRPSWADQGSGSGMSTSTSTTSSSTTLTQTPPRPRSPSKLLSMAASPRWAEHSESDFLNASTVTNTNTMGTASTSDFGNNNNNSNNNNNDDDEEEDDDFFATDAELVAALDADVSNSNNNSNNGGGGGGGGVNANGDADVGPVVDGAAALLVHGDEFSLRFFLPAYDFHCVVLFFSNERKIVRVINFLLFFNLIFFFFFFFFFKFGEREISSSCRVGSIDSSTDATQRTSQCKNSAPFFLLFFFFFCLTSIFF
jgi:hypothetical protein